MKIEEGCRAIIVTNGKLVNVGKYLGSGYWEVDTLEGICEERQLKRTNGNPGWDIVEVITCWRPI